MANGRCKWRQMKEVWTYIMTKYEIKFGSKVKATPQELGGLIAGKIQLMIHDIVFYARDNPKFIKHCVTQKITVNQRNTCASLIKLMMERLDIAETKYQLMMFEFPTAPPVPPPEHGPSTDKDDGWGGLSEETFLDCFATADGNENKQILKHDLSNIKRRKQTCNI